MNEFFLQKIKTDDTRILIKCDKNSDALILGIFFIPKCLETMIKISGYLEALMYSCK